MPRCFYQYLPTFFLVDVLGSVGFGRDLVLVTVLAEVLLPRVRLTLSRKKGLTLSNYKCLNVYANRILTEQVS